DGDIGIAGWLGGPLAHRHRADEPAVGAEDLDSGIAGVRDEDQLAGHRQPGRLVELARAAAERAERRHSTIGGEANDPGMTLIEDVDRIVGTDRDVAWAVEAGLRAGPLADEDVVLVELLEPLVCGVGDEDVAARID